MVQYIVQKWPKQVKNAVARLPLYFVVIEDRCNLKVEDSKHFILRILC